MKRSTTRTLTLALFTLFASVGANAQQATATASKPAANEKATATETAKLSGLRADVLRQIEDAEKKLIQLAEATPADKYTWRPAEGVRSNSEVFMHVAGGNYFIPTFAGVKMPEGVGRDLEKITDKAKVVETLKSSFAHARRAVEQVSDAELDKQVKLFGGDSSVRNVLLLMATHAHEHLGQAIAYARMNGITPPWSAAAQQSQ